MLDGTQSDTESDIQSLLEDSEPKFNREEPISYNNKENHEILSLRATVHVESTVKHESEPPCKWAETESHRIEMKPHIEIRQIS